MDRNKGSGGSTKNHDKSIQRELLAYALPSIVGMVIVGIQTFVDGIFVAKGVGTLGLAAVNLSMPMISVMLSVTIMIISGGIVVAGVEKGRGNEPLARGYTTLTFAVLAAAGVLMALLVGLNLKRLCYFLGANDAVYPHMRRYLGVIGCGFLFYCIPNFTEAFNRLAGRPNWVFLSGTICCVVNVVLDYFFVLRLDMGTLGAAVATCAANSSAAVVLAPNVRMGRIRGNWATVKRMMFNGSSELFTSVSAAVTTFVFNLVLMRQIGPTGVAALTIVNYLNFFVNISIFGLSQALFPLMSFQLGTRSYNGISTLLRTALMLSGCIGVGTYLLVQLLKGPIVGVFANGDAQLLEVAWTATTLVTIHYLFSFANIIGSSFHTAVERPIESVAIAVCRCIVFVMPPLFLLTPLIGQTGIWLSMPIAEVLTLCVSLPLMARTLRRLKVRFGA